MIDNRFIYRKLQKDMWKDIVIIFFIFSFYRFPIYQLVRGYYLYKLDLGWGFICWLEIFVLFLKCLFWKYVVWTISFIVSKKVRLTYARFIVPFFLIQLMEVIIVVRYFFDELFVFYDLSLLFAFLLVIVYKFIKIKSRLNFYTDLFRE